MSAAVNVDVSTFVPNTLIARTLRVRAEYCRSLLYVVIGGWAALALTAAIGPAPVDRARVVAMTIIFGVVPSLFWISANTYRLTVDEEGLSRRRLWFLTHWPWEDFLAGKVRLSEKDGILTHCERPYWDRWIMLAFLTPEDLPFVMELVRRTSPTASPIVSDVPMPIAEELELNLFPFRKLLITRDGCTWQRNGELLLWSEVSEFRIERQRVKSQNFFRLHFLAGDQPQTGQITLIRSTDKWRSPREDEPETWTEQLRQLVRPRCWAYFRSHGELSSVDEGRFRLKLLDDQLRMMKWFEWIGWAFLPASALMFGPGLVGWWNMPFLGVGWKIAATACCLLTIVQPTVMLVALTRHTRAACLKNRAETEREMAELAAREVKPAFALAVHAA